MRLASNFGCGFGSGFFVCGDAVTSSGLSTTLAAGSAGVFFSAIFSTSGFGVSALGALRAPARNCENSVEEMRSTGIDSVGGVLSAFGANDTNAHSSTAACALADMVSPVFMAIGAGSRPLLDLRHQRNAVEAGRGEPPHDPHHGTVIHFAIPAHVDALVRSAASLGDRFELCNEILDLDLGILQEHLALAVDRHRQRLAV